jgi:hypothetical protein
MRNQRKEFKIYRNLHRDCFSVLKYNKEKKGYRLFSHEKDLVCSDVNFTISKAGRDRVLLEKKKNVHAFVICQNYSIFVEEPKLGDQVYYNPYKMETFQVKATGEPIHSAGTVIMTNNKCYLNGQ